MEFFLDGVLVDESEVTQEQWDAMETDYVDPNEMEEPVLVLDEDGFYVPESKTSAEEDCN